MTDLDECFSTRIEDKVTERSVMAPEHFGRKKNLLGRKHTDEIENL